MAHGTKELYPSAVKRLGGLAAAMLLGVAVCHGTATSATLTISGTVPKQYSIDVAPNSTASALMVDGSMNNPSDPTVVAAVLEHCNYAGYWVTITTVNNTSGSQAFLKGSGGNTDQVDYTLYYGGTKVVFNAGSYSTPASSAATPRSGLSKNLAITIADQWVGPDSYSDTVTLTISAP